MELVRIKEPAGCLSHPPSTEVPDFSPVDFQQKKYEKLPDLIAALGACPSDAALSYQLGLRLLKKENYSMAEQVLRGLLKRENCFEVLEALATCLYHLGKWGECAHFTRQALMLGEGFRDQRFALLKFLGNSLIQLRDLDGAREAYEKAFVLFPGSDVLHVNFGTLWIQTGDWNMATECFRHALFLNEENGMAWVGLALCHRFRGDYELAFANAERAVDSDPMNETALVLLLDWSRNRAEFASAQERFLAYADAGGFSPALSRKFVASSQAFGEERLAEWEEFHLNLRSGQTHV